MQANPFKCFSKLLNSNRTYFTLALFIRLERCATIRCLYKSEMCRVLYWYMAERNKNSCNIQHLNGRWSQNWCHNNNFLLSSTSCALLHHSNHRNKFCNDNATAHSHNQRGNEITKLNTAPTLPARRREYSRKIDWVLPVAVAICRKLEAAYRIFATRLQTIEDCTHTNANPIDKQVWTNVAAHQGSQSVLCKALSCEQRYLSNIKRLLAQQIGWHGERSGNSFYCNAIKLYFSIFEFRKLIIVFNYVFRVQKELKKYLAENGVTQPFESFLVEVRVNE